ncbi:MAG TPA: hypothetical protein VNS63_03505 [Blastocatellia bacterium]|nr:hypothetical protein [Blastocatellia bacterium]
METSRRRSAVFTLLSAVFFVTFICPPVASLAQTKSEPYGERTAYIISRIDDAVTKELQKAWQLSGNGYERTEVLILLCRMQNGSISARLQGRSGQYRRFDFRWSPATIALLHTHPNGDEPRPLGEDLKSADRLGIPVFTITLRGMYVYDPATKKISMVQEGLDWLESTKWTKDRQAAAPRR